MNLDDGTARQIRRPKKLTTTCLQGMFLKVFRSWCAVCVQGRGRARETPRVRPTKELEDGSDGPSRIVGLLFRVGARNRNSEAEAEQRADSLGPGVAKTESPSHFLLIDFPSCEKVVKIIVQV